MLLSKHEKKQNPLAKQNSLIEHFMTDQKTAVYDLHRLHKNIAEHME